MTRQQADKILKAFTDISACDGNSEEVSELAKELREAVGKQVPRKLEKCKEIYYQCPTCKTVFREPHAEIMPKWYPYCQLCGQKFDYEGWNYDA